jgi:hypothetical protein
MTVSRLSLEITRSGEPTSLLGDFTTGAPLHKNWTILGANPSSVIMMPPRSVYRAEWPHPCGLGPGEGRLEHSVDFIEGFFGEFGIWTVVAPPSGMLGNGRNIVFVSEDYTMRETGFFRAVFQ